MWSSSPRLRERPALRLEKLSKHRLYFLVAANEARAAVTAAAMMSADLERVKENLRHAELQLAEWRERHTDAKREVERRGRLLEEAEVGFPASQRRRRFWRRWCWPRRSFKTPE